MKKSLLCLLLIMTAMLGTNAHAAPSAEYNEDTGMVISDATEVKNVRITDSENKIWYINQAEKGAALNAAAGFAMKANAPDGTYTLALGFNDVGSFAVKAEEVMFTISRSSKDTAMAELTGAETEAVDGKFSKCFVTEEPIVLSKFNSLKFVFGEGDEATSMYYPINKLNIPVISGDGSVMLGVQLDSIPIVYKGKVSLYFSTVTIPETQLEGGEV